MTFTATVIPPWVSSEVSGVREPLAGSKSLQPISYGRIMLLAWASTDLRRQNLQRPELAGRGSAAATGLGASRPVIVVEFTLVYEFCKFSSNSMMCWRLSIERFQNLKNFNFIIFCITIDDIPVRHAIAWYGHLRIDAILIVLYSTPWILCIIDSQYNMHTNIEHTNMWLGIRKRLSCPLTNYRERAIPRDYRTSRPWSMKRVTLTAIMIIWWI